MANVNSVNKAKLENNPANMIDTGEYSGKVRSLYDSYVFPANAFSASDNIVLQSLPKGARVVDAIVKAPSLGTTGIFSLGYFANGVDSEDLDAFVVSADAGGQAVLAKMPAGAAGAFKKFEAETSLVLDCTEVTQAAAGLKIEVVVLYVLD